ncbi:hypothetical protein [Streptomyces sp. NPDC058623]|uniref:hypothetical protein n=1 Tax=Streptomyces sp. NPDC058623 TaxID=3346563 RepID=UPI00365D42DA
MELTDRMSLGGGRWCSVFTGPILTGIVTDFITIPCLSGDELGACVWVEAAKFHPGWGGGRREIFGRVWGRMREPSIAVADFPRPRSWRFGLWPQRVPAQARGLTGTGRSRYSKSMVKPWARRAADVRKRRIAVSPKRKEA